jgi:hypothetical protein
MGRFVMDVDRSLIDEIIKSANVCHIAMSDGGQPYVIPVSFGYDGNNLYFHGRAAGKKIDILKANDRVSFEFTVGAEVVHSDKPCKWNFRYRSVVGFGRATFLDDLKEKEEGLSHILRQYSSVSFQLPEKAVQTTTVIKISIKSLSSRVSEPK